MSEPNTAGRLLTARRLRLYAVSILIGASVGFAVFIATSNGVDAAWGGRVGGDFPAFYGAGRIAREDVHELYDATRQRQAQADLFPAAEKGWVHFAYPPFFALAYAPLTFLGFKAAFIVHTFLMAGCAVMAVLLLRSISPPLASHTATVVAAVLTFYPMFRAIVGGQNTALSLLCAAGVVASLARGKQGIAGLWVGLWLFKPQLALPVAAVVLWRHPRSVVGIAVPAAIYYVVGSLQAGLAWPLWWWREGVAPFVATSMVFDRLNGISLVEVFAHLGMMRLGVVVAAIVAIVTLATLARVRREEDAIALTVLAALLVSTHALFYDAGVAVLSVVVVATTVGSRALPWVVALWLLAATQALRPVVPIPPLTVLLLGVFVGMLVVVVRRPADRSSG